MLNQVLPAAGAPSGASALLVEDEPLLQLRLRRALGQLGFRPQNVCVAGSLAQARGLLAGRVFVLAFVDLTLPDGQGGDLIADMRRLQPDACIVVGAAWSSSAAVLHALRAGASGYVHKERDDAEVIEVLGSAMRGGATIDPMMAQEILRAGLAKRFNAGELALLELTVQGRSHREVGASLGLARHEIEQRVHAIYCKLHVP